MRIQLFLLTTLYTSSLLASSICANYELSASALFLQPNSNNLYYGAEAIPLPIPSPNWESLEIQPDHHLGFAIDLKTHLSITEFSINLAWEHLYSSDSASKSVAEANMLGPYFNIGPEAQPYKIARGTAHHEFDNVDITLGRQWMCGKWLDIYCYGGLAFSRIKQTLHSHFSNVAGTITRDVKASSLYSGVGPKIGLDLSYNLCRDFFLTNKNSLSLLTGTLKNGTKFFSTTPLLSELDITPPNKQGTKVPNRTQVVPAFSESLGIAYSTCCRSCQITVELGYQIEAYINAIQSVDMSTEVTIPPKGALAAEVGVFALGFQRTLSNFFLTGPYLSLNLMF